MNISLPDFKGKRIVVVGDVMLDSYWMGGVSRISPEAPVPVVQVLRIVERPGGAGNVALNLADLGINVTLLGLVGEDSAAEKITQHLIESGVDCRFLRVAGHPTINKTRVISKNQQLIRLDFESSFQREDARRLTDLFSAAIKNADAVIFSDYNKGSLACIDELIALGKRHSVPMLVDPKGKDYRLYAGATLLTPNWSEFIAVVGDVHNEEELVEKGERLMQEYHWEALLVTRGEQGMTLLQRELKAMHIPTVAQEVYDVTGAGDTVIAVLAAGVAAGLELQDATALANLAAGLVVAKLGAATVKVEELERELYKRQKRRSKILSLEELKQQVARVRHRGERVVMTNGCFDVLHAGHVHYLAQAKALGSRLIVAVNEDASVRGLKGTLRPLNAFLHRLQVLAALESVDWLIGFSEETPERLICEILPDVLVKGGDYQPEQIAGYQCVRQHGGEVKVLDYVEGFSTTALLDKIKSDRPVS